VPKKDAERRRRNKSPESSGSISSLPAEVVNVDEILAGEVEIPKADPKWHAIAREIYEGQIASGQVIWMEPSDWATLYLICESISRDLNDQPIGIHPETGKVIKAKVPLKGASLSAYLKAFEALMMNEGGRRRLRVELEREKRLDAAAKGGGKVIDIVQERADAFKGA
jgi:hypothetical protein